MPADADPRQIPKAKRPVLAAFTETMVASRGLPAQTDLDAFRAAGYTDAHVLRIILAIGVETFSNYANHLMHTEVETSLPATPWRTRNGSRAACGRSAPATLIAVGARARPAPRIAHGWSTGRVRAVRVTRSGERRARRDDVYGIPVVSALRAFDPGAPIDPPA